MLSRVELRMVGLLLGSKIWRAKSTCSDPHMTLVSSIFAISGGFFRTALLGCRVPTSMVLLMIDFGAGRMKSSKRFRGVSIFG